MTRTGTKKDTKSITKGMTKTGTESKNTKYTKTPPDKEGYYWVRIAAFSDPQPAFIFKNDGLYWNSNWKIKFIGDTYDYSLPFAEREFDLRYGSKCK